MYCGNCGADIPAHLRFCTACGAPTDNEETRVATEETRVAAPAPRPVVERADATPAPRWSPQEATRAVPVRRTADDAEEERVIFTVRPTFLFVGLGYGLAA